MQAARPRPFNLLAFYFPSIIVGKRGDEINDKRMKLDRIELKRELPIRRSDFNEETASPVTS